MNTEEKTEVLGPNQLHCHCPPQIPHRLLWDLNSPSGDRQATSGLRRVTGIVIVIWVCALISGLQSFCAETYEGSGNGVAWRGVTGGFQSVQYTWPAVRAFGCFVCVLQFNGYLRIQRAKYRNAPVVVYMDLLFCST